MHVRLYNAIEISSSMLTNHMLSGANFCKEVLCIIVYDLEHRVGIVKKSCHLNKGNQEIMIAFVEQVHRFLLQPQSGA